MNDINIKEIATPLRDFFSSIGKTGNKDFKEALEALQGAPGEIVAQIANPKQSYLMIDGKKIDDKYSQEAMLSISYFFQKNERVLSMIMNLIEFLKKIEEKAGGNV